MKITLGQAAYAFMALNRLKTERVRMDNATCLSLVRLKKLLQPEAEAFEETYINLLDRYAMKDRQGNPIQQGAGGFAIPADKLADYRSELKELRGAKVEIEYKPITIKGDDIRLDMDLVEALEGLVEFGG